VNQHLNSGGYWATYMPEHPRATHNGDVRVHILVAEKALGKPLPHGVYIHHWEKMLDNSKIVICQDRAYHHLLHQRTEALDVTGHANWRKCCWCSKFSDPNDPESRMTLIQVKALPNGNGQAYHRRCARNYQRNRAVK